MGILILSLALNFLDRQLVAAVAPQLKGEFLLLNTEYWPLVAAFSLAYAVFTPVAGLFIDRVGITLGGVTAVSVWSMSGMATGIVRGIKTLLLCRGVLGAGEAAGLPFVSKATAVYLPLVGLHHGIYSSGLGIVIVGGISH